VRSKLRFIDRVRIQVRAGDGGDGVTAWRREAHVPKGGPAGGDGGRGGDVFFVASDQVVTLLDLKFRQHHRAESGGRGGNKGMHGRGGEDLFIRVPIGTGVYFEGKSGAMGERPPWVEPARDPHETGMEVIYVEPDADEKHGVQEEQQQEEQLARRIMGDGPRVRRDKRQREEWSRGELIGDLVDEGQVLRVAHGGLGGRGNIRFRSSTQRSPDECEEGSSGDASWLRLELKLLADVGLVGFPNVGKSTLIRQISAARPEVGAYPFTTLTPQLGVVSLSDERSMIVADIPGLIRGASEGRGLGHQFLRHLERTRVLVHLLAPDPTPGRDPLADLEALEHELTHYGTMFAGRPRVVALNKMDTPIAQSLLRDLKKALRKRNIPVFPICAATGEGVGALLDAVWRRLELVRRRDRAQRVAEQESEP